MINKVLFGVFTCFYLAGCTSVDDTGEITNNERHLVSGSVIEANGTPLNNIDVRLGYGIEDRVFRPLGESVSEANGTFEFISLVSKRLHTLSINGFNDTLKSTINVIGFSTDENTFSATQVRLKKTAYLQLEIIDTGVADTLFYKTNYISPFCQELFQGTNIDDIRPIGSGTSFELTCYPQIESEVSEIPPFTSSSTISIRSLHDTNIQVFYKTAINDEFTIVSIPLTNTSNNYVLQY